MKVKCRKWKWILESESAQLALPMQEETVFLAYLNQQVGRKGAHIYVFTLMKSYTWKVKIESYNMKWMLEVKIEC